MVRAAVRSPASMTEPDSVTTPSWADTPNEDLTAVDRSRAAATVDCNSMLPGVSLDVIIGTLLRPLAQTKQMRQTAYLPRWSSLGQAISRRSSCGVRDVQSSAGKASGDHG